MPSHRLKQLLASFAVASYLLITYLLIYYLKNPELRNQEDILILLSVLSSLYLIPVIIFGTTLGIISTSVLIFLIFLVLILETAVTGYLLFFIIPLVCLVFLLLIWWGDKRKEDILLSHDVEMEKNIQRKNELELALKEKSEAVNSYFDRYSRFYNLRRVAEDFATSLQIENLGRVIVERSLSFVRKGDVCLLYVLNSDGVQLSLISSKSLIEGEKPKMKRGDVFDWWVVKNRQHLVVPDVDSDYRFDVKEEALEDVKGVMISPLLSHGRVIGVLRMNSKDKNVFSTDDLRLLDLISGLAASALANSLLYQQTEELAIRDSLTSLFIHRYFKERLKEEHKRALLSKSSLSLLMCDLDFFKTYNDRFGHAAGDIVLKEISNTLKEIVKEDGMVARYGGEEFAVLLPNTNKEQAVKMAELIRSQIDSRKFMLRNEMTKVTASLGVSTFPQDTLEEEELIRVADERLYVAKKQGRNQVCSNES